MTQIYIKLVLCAVCLIESRAMMMRNDALISKMVSNFQKEKPIPGPVTPRSNQQPKNILSIMQGVLCRNFPTIPCDMIVEDDTLRTLIEKSIQQLKYKKMSMERTTVPPGYHLTLFPTINSEDLSNFLQVSETGYYSKDKEKSRGHKHRKRLARHNNEEKEIKKKSSKKRDGQRTAIYNGNKKIRKFYPHKIKYKDKQNKASRDNYKDYSDEKLSISVELPEATGGRKRMISNYNMDPVDPPVWRIDYMKHGEPSLNMFGYEPESLKEKLVKTGPNVIVGDNMMEQPRKDVLHNDVYIKKNFIRKNGIDLNSEPID